MQTIEVRTLDGEGNDQVLGQVIWDGETATPTTKVDFVVKMAESINEADDPEAFFQEMPRVYKSPYLRAEILDDEDDADASPDAD